MKNKILFLAGLLFLFAVNSFAQGGKAEPNRIKFAKGKSAAVLTGNLKNNEEMEYVFAAKTGQKVTLKVTSNPRGDFFDFSLKGDGFKFQTDLDSYDAYDFTAPGTGDYLVFVRKRPTDNTPKAKFYFTLSIK